MTSVTEPAGTLLYDPDCGLCTASSKWLAEHAGATRLAFRPRTEEDRTTAGLPIAVDRRSGRVALESMYRLVAAHRTRIGRAFGLTATCAIPLTRARD